MGGGVEGVDAVGAEGADEEVAFLEIGAEGAVAEGGVEVVDGRFDTLVEFLFAEAGEEDEVAVAEEVDGAVEVGAVFGAEVGEEDDEGAAFLHGHDALGGFGEVAGLGGGLVVVEVVEDEGHGVRTFDGLQPAGFAAEAEDADVVALAEGDVREEKHGVEAVVELGEFAVEGAHAAAAVGDEEEGLIALFFVVATDEGAAAGGGLPVDAGEDVAVLVFAELMEVEGGTGAAAFDDAHLVLAIGHGEEGIADDGFVVGVAAGVGGGADAEGALPESEAGAGEEVGGGEGLGAALGEMEVVGEGGGFVGREGAVPGECGGFGSGREAVDEFEGEGAGEGMGKGKGDGGGATEGEAAREGALELDLAGFGEGEGVNECGEAEKEAGEQPGGAEGGGPDGGEETEGGPGEREAEEERGGAHRQDRRRSSRGGRDGKWIVDWRVGEFVVGWGMKRLSHLDEAGRASMVDVSAKPAVMREAVAEAFIALGKKTLRMIADGQTPKGDVLAVARVAGIQAAKQTQLLIPLCHQIPLSKVAVDFVPDAKAGGIRITTVARTVAATGVEMEALTAASVAALTIYDMCKAVDKAMRIDGVRLVSKVKG